MSKEEYKDAIEVSVIFHEGQQMFAVPKQPAQRTWQPLTDEERNVINRHNVYVSDIISATEAKLKEKNT
jgi:hypothetical protein